MRRMPSAISDRGCYIIIIYKTRGKIKRPWGKKAWPYHLGWFALSLVCIYELAGLELSKMWACPEKGQRETRRSSRRTKEIHDAGNGKGGFFIWEGTVSLKNLPANAGDTRDMGSIPGLGRSHGGGNGNPLQYSCLGNPMVREPDGLQAMGSQRETTERLSTIVRYC